MSEALGRIVCWLGLHRWSRWESHGAAFIIAGIKPTLCCMHRYCKRPDCEAEDFD